LPGKRAASSLSGLENNTVPWSVELKYREALINANLALSERGSRKMSFSTALQINGLEPLIWRYIHLSREPQN
jgi:hypothetical protein